MTAINFLRHNSFFSPEDVQNTTLNIIGVGATGSWVGFLAAKMGWHNFRIWDPDIVESHNCPNQAYDISFLNRKKVDAFEETLKRFNPQIQVEKYDCYFESTKHMHLLDDAVFVAVDSLNARKDIFSAFSENDDLDIIFETSMGFTHAHLNVFDPWNYDSIDDYINNLKLDSEVQEAACNERIITTLTNIVASNLVHILCGYYSSLRSSLSDNPKYTFNYNQKYLYSLTNNLQVYSLNS